MLAHALADSVKVVLCGTLTMVEPLSLVVAMTTLVGLELGSGFPGGIGGIGGRGGGGDVP